MLGQEVNENHETFNQATYFGMLLDDEILLLSRYWKILCVIMWQFPNFRYFVSCDKVLFQSRDSLGGISDAESEVNHLEESLHSIKSSNRGKYQYEYTSLHQFVSQLYQSSEQLDLPVQHDLLFLELLLLFLQGGYVFLGKIQDINLA